jgi:hypothetical protein
MYAKQHNIHVRFIDLPVAHQFALENEKKQGEEVPASLNDSSDVIEENAVVSIASDPVTYLAQAAAMKMVKTWWEHTFEYRHNNGQVFEAVAEAMDELRKAFPGRNDYIESYAKPTCAK